MGIKSAYNREYTLWPQKVVRNLMVLIVTDKVITLIQQTVPRSAISTLMIRLQDTIVLPIRLGSAYRCNFIYYYLGKDGKDTIDLSSVYK